MELRGRVKVDKRGRVVFPAAMREVLEMNVGCVLDWRTVDGELRVTTRESRIRRAQMRASALVPPGTLVSDELSAERREAAEHE